MKNKYLIFKILSLISITPMLDWSLSSCSENGDYVSINKKTFFSTSQEQSLIISVNNSKVKYVSLLLQNVNSPYFYLDQLTVDVVDNKICPIVRVDSSVWNLPLNATFDLNLTLLDENNNTINQVTLQGFSVFFRGQDILNKDRVYCPKEDQILTIYGKHVATFRFILYKQIQSDVYLELIDPQGLLTLPQTTVTAKKDPTPGYLRWFVDVDVSVPLGASKKVLYDLELKLHFKNSFGVYQIQDFPNLSIQYNQKDKTIPLEFYNIENGVLIGWKPDVLSQIVNYDTIELPDTVTVISASAFGTTSERRNIWRSIKKIIFPESVQIIEPNGLSGLINLFEIDISKYPQGSLPSWFTSEIALFDPTIMLQPCGYIWTSENDYDSDQIKRCINKIRLNNQWIAMRFDRVTPDYIFNIVDYEDPSTHEKYTKLTGVIDKYIDSLWMYAVIRIPDNVTYVDPACFTFSFGVKPFFKKDLSSNASTRRLILNDNLEYADSLAFSNCGIAGPLVINKLYNLSAQKEERKNIFQNGCFSNIGFYYDTKGLEYTIETISLYINAKWGDIPDGFVSTTHSLDETKNLFKHLTLQTGGEKIGKNAFRYSNICGPITLPGSLKEIDDSAFYLCSLINEEEPEKSTLTIPSTVEKIGSKAFSRHELRELIIERDQNDFKTLDVGREAFGEIEDGTGAGGHHTLNVIDISCYKAVEESKLPTWLSLGNKVFANATNPTIGIIYVSQEIYDTYETENDVLSTLAAQLHDNGVPTIIMPGKEGEFDNWHFQTHK